ncbi:MAG TPA: tetratricopeptide repeat protein [Sedimentisphaerales bacterium]|nr:tetratricopeptide repeat protein [Sedimentisphaerales bacterium]
MRTFIRVFCAIIVILAGAISGCGKNQQCPGSPETSREEFEIKRGLDDGLRVECDLLADSLLKREGPSVDDGLAAAQLASICERPNRAISILEGVINRDGDEKVNVVLGWHIPVKILGHLWIGTIARQAGDVAKAKNAYKTTLKDIEDVEVIGEESLAAICHLYLAEIEAEHLKRPDRALRYLRAIGHVESPEGNKVDLYKDWALYQHARISKGKDHAAKQLSYSGETPNPALFAVIHLYVSGVIPSRLGEYIRPEKQELFAKAFFDRAMVRTKGSVDTRMLRLVYGKRCEETESFNEAEKHYSALFEDESYFSPLAGILLAKCKSQQGKIADTDEILQKVIDKYPGYESFVAEFKKIKQEH